MLAQFPSGQRGEMPRFGTDRTKIATDGAKIARKRDSFPWVLPEKVAICPRSKRLFAQFTIWPEFRTKFASKPRHSLIDSNQADGPRKECLV